MMAESQRPITGERKTAAATGCWNSLRHNPHTEIMILPLGYHHEKGRLAIRMGRVLVCLCCSRQIGIMTFFQERFGYAAFSVNPQRSSSLAGYAV